MVFFFRPPSCPTWWRVIRRTNSMKTKRQRWRKKRRRTRRRSTRTRRTRRRRSSFARMRHPVIKRRRCVS